DTSAIGASIAASQGAKIFNATYERIWRGLRKELATYLIRLRQLGDPDAVSFEGRIIPAASAKSEDEMAALQQQQDALAQAQVQAKIANDQAKLQLQGQELALKAQELQIKNQ